MEKNTKAGRTLTRHELETERRRVGAEVKALEVEHARVEDALRNARYKHRELVKETARRWKKE